MKRKILFVVGSLDTGGVSKSMTSLMNVIDRNRYEVALMVISPYGKFMSLLPQDLRLITNPQWDALTSRLSGFAKLLRLGRPLQAIAHVLRLGISVISKSQSGEMLAELMDSIDEEFDTVVDFNGQHQLYYIVKKIKAAKKVSFFHSDYEKWPYYFKADKKYLSKVDYIFTVSQRCVESMIKFFPEEKHKIGLMENITSLSLIEKMSEAVITDLKTDVPILLTVGHVCESKGFYWAIEAATILKAKKIGFRWYFLGSIDNEKEYKQKIRSLHLDDEVILLGIRTNPYPYIKTADIIVHPSKFEGRSIALDEAKLLCKPIVVTNFSTVKDQFEDDVNALICEMNGDSLAQGIERMLGDSNLQKKFIQNLSLSRHDNSDEIEKLYHIFDE